MAELYAMSKDELTTKREEYLKEYNNYKEMGLKLNMSRGKPGAKQLDLSNELLEGVHDYHALNNLDVRNYGVLDGLPELKRIFSDLLDVPMEDIIIGGNSALNLIYDTFARLFLFGTLGNTPWGKLDKVKIICLVPGYDRHFAICEEFGTELISVPLNDDGPDMDMVEKIVSEDESVKGIMCVPMYSNPSGIVYSDEVIERLAKMKTAAKDFRIFYDNAYAVHHIYKENKLANIFELAKKYGNEDRIYMYFSTSKVAFPGSGVSMICASPKNVEEIKKRMSIQTIGYNKLNQLSCVKFFKNAENIKNHMKKHAAILKPKFDIVFEILENNFNDNKICKWSKPDGGYFITLYTYKGCAKEVVRLAKEAGVIVTNAGATHPYGNNPDDDCIRLAPSYPYMEELKVAMEVIASCVKLATVEKLIAEK